MTHSTSHTKATFSAARLSRDRAHHSFDGASGAAWVLWLLFALSGVSLAIAMERLWVFRRGDGNVQALVPELRRLLRVIRPSAEAAARLAQRAGARRRRRPLRSGPGRWRPPKRRWRPRWVGEETARAAVVVLGHRRQQRSVRWLAGHRESVWSAPFKSSVSLKPCPAR